MAREVVVLRVPVTLLQRNQALTNMSIMCYNVMMDSYHFDTDPHDDHPPLRPFYGDSPSNSIAELADAVNTLDKLPVFDPNALPGKEGAITRRTRRQVLADLGMCSLYGV